MTCDLCRRPTRREQLEPAYHADNGVLIGMSCPRCRLPQKRRPLWDAMQAAEAAVVRDPDDRAVYRALVTARYAFDRSGPLPQTARRRG